LAFQIKKRGQAPRVVPEFTELGDDKIIGSTVWSNERGDRIERFQVITFRNGKIVDMQGCSSRREAERFARRAEP
jgi:hypothetical protein